MSLNEYDYYLSKIRSWTQHLSKMVKNQTADRILDNIVTLFIQMHEFQKIQGILGNIGIFNVREGFANADSHDRALIGHHNPIFFNFTNHRLVNKSDVSSVLAQAGRYLHQFL